MFTESASTADALKSSPDGYVDLELTRLLRRALPITLIASLAGKLILHFYVQSHLPGVDYGVLLALSFLHDAGVANLWQVRPRTARGAARWLMARRTLALLSAVWGVVTFYQLWVFTQPESRFFEEGVLLALAFAAANAVLVAAMPRTAMAALLMTSVPVVFAMFGRLESAPVLATVWLAFVYVFWYIGHNIFPAFFVALRDKANSRRLLRQLAAESRAARTANVRLDAERGLAERAHRRKDLFFAAASHDLRQPLFAMSLLYPVLAQETDPEQRRKLLHGLRSNHQTLKAILDGIIQLARIEGGLRVAPVEFELQPLFDSVERQARAQFPNGPLLLVKPTRARVKADPAIFESVLLHLVVNALAVAPEGCVMLAARPWRGVVEVRDNGRGLTANEIANIFEAFYQTDNPSRQRGRRRGLGLALVQGMLDRSGQRCVVRSRPGAGAVFAVSVDMLRVRACGLPQEAAHASARESAHDPAPVNADEQAPGLAGGTIARQRND